MLTLLVMLILYFAGVGLMSLYIEEVQDDPSDRKIAKNLSRWCWFAVVVGVYASLPFEWLRGKFLEQFKQSDDE